MLKAVIIDDEQAGIRSLEVLLKNKLNSVDVIGTSTDSSEGIHLIESNHPDVVFLDINMPGMNGFELIEQLSYRDFYLVFVTAHADYAIKAIKNKAFDYLLKPVDVHELIGCVNRILESKEH